MIRWGKYVNEDWYPILSEFLNSKEMERILAILKTQHNVLPEQDKCFRAFNCCPWKSLKVVILGQD